MKFFIKDFCPQFPVDLVTFTEEILNGKFIFCAVKSLAWMCSTIIINWYLKPLSLHYGNLDPFSIGLVGHNWNETWYLVKETPNESCTTQNLKFSIKDFFSKCDQICRKLWGK